MNQIEAIKEAMKHRKAKPVYVAQKLGISEPTFSRYLSKSKTGTSGNLRMETLCKILEAIDYEIVLKPKDAVIKDAEKRAIYTIAFESDESGKGDA